MKEEELGGIYSSVFREVRKVHKIFDGKLKGRHNLGHLVVN
jgi:hypothetical protein